MLQYHKIERNYCTNPTLKTPHSVGEAAEKALEVVNHYQGEITFMDVREHTVPNTDFYKGTVTIIYRADHENVDIAGSFK